jgi:hypothetical protein
MNSSTILLIAGAVVMAGIAATTMSGSPASQSQSQPSQPSYPPPVNNGYPSMGGAKTRRKLGGRKRRGKSRK